jgi:hypothetical protein
VTSPNPQATSLGIFFCFSLLLTLVFAASLVYYT